MKKKYKCGICQTEFDTAEELHFHQQLGHLK
jgi:DNA-directed RNA polymerase subunit RPC12/RpoP